jgi:hypothetical protein
MTVIARAEASPQKNSDTLFAFELAPVSAQLSFTPVRPVPVIVDGAPIDQVIGAPSLLYSTEMGAFELLVPRLRDGRAQIDYYVLPNDTIQHGVWKFVATLPPLHDTRPVAVSMVRSFKPGELEAIARVFVSTGVTSQGYDALARYTFNSQTGWGVPSIVTSDGKPISVGSAPETPLSIGDTPPQV